MARSVAILCNGPSLADHNLNKISCETIGLNRSWELIPSSHHVMADEEQWQVYRRLTGKQPSTIKNLYTAEDGPEGSIKLHFMDSNEPAWSWYPFKLGVYLCGTVTWVALQVAVGLGYTTIYMIGMDMKPREASGKFWGGEWPKKAEPRQRELMGYAAGLLIPSGIEIFNLCPESKCWAFPRRRFDEVFG